MEKAPHPYDHRHLKQVLHKNELVDSLVNARDWARTHLETVLIGVLLLSAAVFGVLFFLNSQKETALKAATLLSEAQGVFQQAGTLSPSEAAQGYSQAFAKFQAVASSYEGSMQAPAAQLGMADCDLAMGKGAEAERAFDALDTRDPKNLIASLASLGKAQAIEAQGRQADAQKAYADTLKTYAGCAVSGAAQAALDRITKYPLPKPALPAPAPALAAAPLAKQGLPAQSAGPLSGAAPAQAAAAPAPAPVGPAPAPAPKPLVNQ